MVHVIRKILKIVVMMNELNVLSIGADPPFSVVNRLVCLRDQRVIGQTSCKNTTCPKSTTLSFVS